MTLYLDHAATSFPKPPAVAVAITRYLATAGNPGRSGHQLARAGEEIIWAARQSLAKLLDAGEPERVVFALNATMALNTAIKGLVEPGDLVLTSSFEHNSVVRPLHALTAAGVHWQPIPPAADEPVDLDWVRARLQAHGAKLIVVSHASNVTGAVVALAPLYELARRYGAILVVDAAQTVGHRPVDVRHADVLVFAGHKGLLGPQGTGGLYMSESVTIRPLVQGGTGGRSEVRDQPKWLPYALESGTPNGVGVAGLGAGVDVVGQRGLAVVAERETELRQRFVRGVTDVAGVRVHQWPGSEPAAGVVSVTFQGMSAVDAAAALEERYGVLVRGGLHCAPLAHETLGTAPSGTVRFSMGADTTVADVDTAVAAVTDLAADGGGRA